MADQKDIDFLRKEFAGLSRSELIHKQNQWMPHPAGSIAARQLLDEWDQRDEQARHEQNHTTANAANRLSRLAIAIALLALGVAGFQAVLQWNDAPKAKAETIAPQLSTTSAQKPPTNSVLLSNTVDAARTN